MKRKLLLWTVFLLLCSSYGMANDTTKTRPMTKYGKAIAKITDSKELKAAYDALETDYDRRYFLNALPGYFIEHEIKNVPGWIKKAVLDGINSNNPQYCREAIVTAGALKISCSNELMTLYKSIPTAFVGHVDMLQSSILISLGNMKNSAKKRFFYKILAAEDIPLGLATFDVLLDVIYTEPDLMYAQKLTEFSSIFGEQIAQITADKDKVKNEYQLQKLQKMKAKIDKVRTKVAAGGKK